MPLCVGCACSVVVVVGGGEGGGMLCHIFWGGLSQLGGGGVALGHTSWRCLA